MSSDELIVIQLERGIDIPGGHVEPFDADIAATAKREAAEEAAIELGEPVYVIGIITSDYKGSAPGDIMYMLITVGRVAKINRFMAKFESVNRVQMTPDAFLRKYQAGSQAMMDELMSRAKKMCTELFQDEDVKNLT